jgi:ElaB/YqjD/DUF883 family membrane-anchored ribosome-binding protein
MHKTTIALAVSATLALSACGKSENPEQSASTPPGSEQSASMTDQAMQAGQETLDKTKEMAGDAADAVASKSQDAYESTKEAVSEAGDAIGEKADEMADTVKE